MTLSRLLTWIVWIGATGTVLLIVTIMTMILTASGPPPTLPTALFVVVIVAWMLSPFWGEIRQQRQRTRTPAEGVVALIALVLMIAMGAHAYLTGWVFYNGPTRTTGQGMLAVLVPLFQWAILAGAAILQWGIRAVVRFRA